ncbi:MAG TPA: hypothetical protein VJM11_19205 [Nevskiaceae bacterium]|nr:hypothetical protein [Nevskiaceae bacterium]
MRRLRWLFLVALATMGGTASAATNTLSLNPFSAYLSNGASIFPTGYSGNLLLTANGGTPGIAFGFTVPKDYGGGKLKLVLLWDSADTGCNIVLTSQFLYRARNGRAQDDGGERTGFLPLAATTPFSVLGGGASMAIGAPDPAQTTERATFTIEPTAGQFGGPFKAGDAINFGIQRLANNEADTCPNAMAISGISVEYETLSPP